jgi:hypothetical protein
MKKRTTADLLVALARDLIETYICDCEVDDDDCDCGGDGPDGALEGCWRCQAFAALREAGVDHRRPRR